MNAGNSRQQKEGRIHEDMLCMNLKVLLSSAGSSAACGRATLDVAKASWQRVSRKGHYPTQRCGFAMSVFKNKGLRG